MAEIVGAGAPDLAPRLASVLRGGGLVIMPCDTIYGIHGRAPEADEAIRSLKGRGETKPFIQLIPDLSWLGRLSPVTPAPALAALWPGPLTLILRSNTGSTVAVRWPADPFLCAVIRATGAPLYSTSVNRSTEPPLTRVTEMQVVFGGGVALIVDGGDQGPGVASTIVDTTSRPYRLVRRGALAVPSELLDDSSSSPPSS